jgi:flavin reductase (DIM6/NTAB) family NADH-FMN oxidoreductase RutF
VTVSALSTNQDLDPTMLREAFGVFPSGVVAVAADVDGELTGLAASSFTSVSLDPPLVSVSLATSSKTWPDLRRSSHLGVTVLADHHADVCRALAGPVERRFDSLAWTTTSEGRSGAAARRTSPPRPATSGCSGTRRTGSWPGRSERRHDGNSRLATARTGDMPLPPE